MQLIAQPMAPQTDHKQAAKSFCPLALFYFTHFDLSDPPSFFFFLNAHFRTSIPQALSLSLVTAFLSPPSAPGELTPLKAPLSFPRKALHRVPASFPDRDSLSLRVKGEKQLRDLPFYQKRPHANFKVTFHVRASPRAFLFFPRPDH